MPGANTQAYRHLYEAAGTVQCVKQAALITVTTLMMGLLGTYSCWS